MVTQTSLPLLILHVPLKVDEAIVVLQVPSALNASVPVEPALEYAKVLPDTWLAVNVPVGVLSLPAQPASNSTAKLKTTKIMRKNCGVLFMIVLLYGLRNLATRLVALAARSP